MGSTDAQQTDSKAADQTLNAELSKDSTIETDGEITVETVEEEVLVIDDGSDSSGTGNTETDSTGTGNTKTDSSGTGNTKTDSTGNQDTSALTAAANHVVLFSNIVIVATALIQMVW